MKASVAAFWTVNCIHLVCTAWCLSRSVGWNTVSIKTDRELNSFWELLFDSGLALRSSTFLIYSPQPQRPMWSLLIHTHFLATFSPRKKQFGPCWRKNHIQLCGFADFRPTRPLKVRNLSNSGFLCTLQSSCSTCGSSSVSFSKVCLFQPEKRGLVSPCGAEASEGWFLQWSVMWWLASVLSKWRNFIWTLSTPNTICFAGSKKQVPPVNFTKFYPDTYFPPFTRLRQTKNQSVTNTSNGADCSDERFKRHSFSPVTLSEASGCKHVCPPAVKLQKTSKASEVQPKFGSTQKRPGRKK